MKRRVFFSVLAGGASAAGWVRLVEPTWFEVSRTRVRLPGVKHRRILHISDIHMSDGLNAADLDRGLRAGLACRPDLICFTGDYVTFTHDFDRQGLLRMLRHAAGSAPTYAVLGNHDGGDWLAIYHPSPYTEAMGELMDSAGVEFLHNRSVVNGDLRLAGTADFWSGEFKPHLAFQQEAPSAATIMLCHNPDAKRELVRYPWNLMLSGHTHGGQGRIPGINPWWTPVEDKRFLAGLYQWENRQIFITRGLGSPMHVRAFCRPEVSILEIGA
jgi:predicted MPP superfamily phosphohydrolase